MRKFILAFISAFIAIITFAQESDTTVVALDEIVVSSFYSSSTTVSSVVDIKTLAETNYGQEPSNVFSKMPSIISLNDNGTEFGYGYFRIRGLDQTRINVSLDGCPWNEAEDYGAYFANSPDLLSSMQTVRVEKGTASSYNGIAGVAGGILLESVNIHKPQESYVYLGGGSFNSFKATAVYNMLPQNGWGLHVKAGHQQTAGFRDFGFNSSQALTLKTGYKFNDKSSIDFLTMNGYHRNGQGWIGNTLEELAVNPRANGNVESETDNWFMSMNRLQHKQWFGDDFLLTSTVYFQFQDGSYRMDLDNYMLRMSDKNWETTGVLYDYGLRHFMTGANIAAKYYLNKANFTVGVNGYQYTRHHFLDDKSLNVLIEEDYSNKGIKNDVSAFLNVQYKPVKGLVLAGNVQYRHADFSYVDFIDKNNSFMFHDYNTNWDFCNFGFNAEYTFRNSLKFYGKFNYVNREPTRSDMFGGNENFTGELATIKPEVAKDAEIGVEYTQSNLYVNLNLYNMWFTNELVLNGEYGLNGLPCHDNADNSYRRGIEADVRWNFWSAFNFDVNGSISENKVYTETFGKTNHILTPCATANADFYWDSYDFRVGINGNWRSSMYVDTANEYSIPDMWTINVYGSYRWRDIELGARLNNITDNVNYCTGAVNDYGEMLYFRNAGFNFNVSIKYIF